MKKYILLLLLFGSIIVSCTKKDDSPAPVPPIVLKSIGLGQDTLTMYVGDVKTISFTLSPSTIDKTTLLWSSSDSTVLSVTNSGVITAKKEGSAILTVSNQNKTITVTALITVKPARPKVDSLKVGLIAYYPFNFDSAVDSSGNGNDGTIFNITSVPDRVWQGKLCLLF